MNSRGSHAGGVAAHAVGPDYNNDESSHSAGSNSNNLSVTNGGNNNHVRNSRKQAVPKKLQMKQVQAKQMSNQV